MSKQKYPSSTTTSSQFEAKKSLGQNFLTSDIVPGWLADAGEVTKGDIILEIGPGTGVLTKKLLQRGAVVYAIETDARAVTLLQETFSTEIAAKQLLLIEADMRDYDLSALALPNEKYKVVANIPYYLSGFLLRLLLEHECHPHLIVFLMQKELVERIARSKKESLLALGVKAFGSPHYYKTVTRGHFRPMPKVDSAILKIDHISHQHFLDNQSRQHFFSILHLGFGQKRKQLQHNLAKCYPKADISTAFSAADLPATVRAEDVSLEQWLTLTNYLPPINNVVHREIP